MNWKRGFKRITIVIAVTCGIVAGFLPIKQYHYARANWWYVNDPIVIRQPTEKELAYLERWQEHNKVIIDDYYVIDEPNSSIEQTLTTVCNNYLEMQRKRFWYNLPKAKLIGICLWKGLVAASGAFVGVWIIVGFAYIVIGWMIRGFTDNTERNIKPDVTIRKNNQNEDDILK